MEKGKITQGAEKGKKKKELKFLKPHCTAPAQAEVPTLPSTVASPSPWSAQTGMETHPEPQGTPTVSPNVPCTPSCLQANITNRPNVNNKTVAAQGTNYFWSRTGFILMEEVLHLAPGQPPGHCSISFSQESLIAD